MVSTIEAGVEAPYSPSGQQEGKCSLLVTGWSRKLIEMVAADASDDLVAERCLVLAPHPDDEVLGCGGTIARKIRQGFQVWIVFLTDGRMGISAPTNEARALRETEAVRAAEILGLPRERLTFLRYEDGRLGDYVHQAAAEVRQLVASQMVEQIFVPYRLEYHSDHQAAWRIGDACRRDNLRFFEYPIWFGPWLWSRLGWRARLAAASHLVDARHAVKVNIADVSDIKRQALAAHHSQVAAFRRQGEWGDHFLANFSGEYEIFFRRR